MDTQENIEAVETKNQVVYTKSSLWLKVAVAFLAATTLGLLASTIYFALDPNTKVVEQAPATQQDLDTNPCEDKTPALDAVDCVINAVEMKGEQTGVNVTKGYQGDLDTEAVPIVEPLSSAGLCPVNVHWHIGTEHYSLGEYDENGSSPVDDFEEEHHGFKCNYFDESDPKFTTPYAWKYCKEMMVGQTYEVHWPHSSAGACGTEWQYQYPFPDGVFCMDGVISFETSAQQIGVQAQVFTIVNDEDYYYPNLFNGMIVDGVMGSDVAKFTGSTTGTSVNNEVCSPFSPITWHVDRKCHLISASSFDKMCMDMIAQADDMSGDLYPHGSRELVSDELAANNHQLRFLRKSL